MKVEKAKQTATAAPAATGNRAAYTPPQVEVIKMDVEGSVMSASGGGTLNDFSSGSSIRQSSVSRSYNSASSSDLEDLINDILTVEQ